VREWAELEKHYIEESLSGECPELYDLLQKLTKEGMKNEPSTKTERYRVENILTKEFIYGQNKNVLVTGEQE